MGLKEVFKYFVAQNRRSLPVKTFTKEAIKTGTMASTKMGNLV